MDQQRNTAAVWHRKYGALASRTTGKGTHDEGPHISAHCHETASTIRSWNSSFLLWFINTMPSKLRTNGLGTRLKNPGERLLPIEIQGLRQGQFASVHSSTQHFATLKESEDQQLAIQQNTMYWYERRAHALDAKTCVMRRP